MSISGYMKRLRKLARRIGGAIDAAVTGGANVEYRYVRKEDGRTVRHWQTPGWGPGHDEAVEGLERSVDAMLDDAAGLAPDDVAADLRSMRDRFKMRAEREPPDGYGTVDEVNI